MFEFEIFATKISMVLAKLSSIKHEKLLWRKRFESRGLHHSAKWWGQAF